MVNLLLAIIYISFISLGLPDSLLGSAWPAMYPEFDVPVSYAGIISMIIALGTIVSSLQSDRLTHKLGTGKVTAISVAMTAAALLAFSFTKNYYLLLLWAIPYGLGAGSVDAALNNYVALHFKSRHMSWLHAMWGVGATAGPYIMGYALSSGLGWNMGYRIISIIQIILTLIILLSLPLWKGEKGDDEKMETEKSLKLKEIISLPGAKEIMLCFFCYCAIEQTSMLWASSYLSLSRKIAVGTAAVFSSMFFIGITAGRFLCGFITMKLSDTAMIRLGQAFIAVGVITLFLPATVSALIGLSLIGLGCAPIYPSIIHSTPAHFGADRSQAIIGIEMASAYVGTCLMPPLFGFIANRIGTSIFPFYLAIILILMILMHETLVRKVPAK